jgi:hypothetical protein
MAVRDLAPALLALGDIFHETNSVLNPAFPDVQLDVRAFNPGSFDVILHLAQELHDHGVQALTSPDVVALGELVTVVGAFFALVKQLRGRRIVREEAAETPGTTRLILDNGDVIETPAASKVLYTRSTIRNAAKKVVDPLYQDGIEELRFTVDEQTIVSINADDAEAFTVDLADTPLGSQHLMMGLTLNSVSFVRGNKWKLNDGANTHWMQIEDEAFMDDVLNDREAFAKGDVLRCRVRMDQWQVEGGLKIEWAVEKVLEHLPAAREMPLPFDHQDGDS